MLAFVKFLEWKKKNPYADLDPVQDLQKDDCSLSLELADDGSYLMKCEEDVPCPIFSPLAPFDKIWFHFKMRPKQAYNNIEKQPTNPFSMPRAKLPTRLPKYLRKVTAQRRK